MPQFFLLLPSLLLHDIWGRGVVMPPLGLFPAPTLLQHMCRKADVTAQWLAPASPVLLHYICKTDNVTPQLRRHPAPFLQRPTRDLPPQVYLSLHAIHVCATEAALAKFSKPMLQQNYCPTRNVYVQLLQLLPPLHHYKSTLLQHQFTGGKV